MLTPLEVKEIEELRRDLDGLSGMQAIYCDHIDKMFSDRRELVKLLGDTARILDAYIWQGREKTCPGDPFCLMCGAGRDHAAKYGHQPACIFGNPVVVELMKGGE